MAKQPLRGDRESELFSISETLKLVLLFDNVDELKNGITTVIKSIERNNKPRKLGEKIFKHS